MYLEKKQDSISLRFSVTGKPVVLIRDVDTSMALKQFVKEALVESASARPIEDYDVVFKGNKLDSAKKVASFDFPVNAVIMLSLKGAMGAGRFFIVNKIFSTKQK
ncbi:MAG: hypothetical protein K9H49_07420 [Bacteroidales bacterium]|nr:hypothetical protein [Bacteroidales bacterium]MCF8390341.1 hypothetical protein [Bacteroidales bacterium]